MFIYAFVVSEFVSWLDYSSTKYKYKSNRVSIFFANAAL